VALHKKRFCEVREEIWESTLLSEVDGMVDGNREGRRDIGAPARSFQPAALPLVRGGVLEEG
jgi:hypothetical protein